MEPLPEKHLEGDIRSLISFGQTLIWDLARYSLKEGSCKNFVLSSCKLPSLSHLIVRWSHFIRKDRGTLDVSEYHSLCDIEWPQLILYLPFQVK